VRRQPLDEVDRADLQVLAVLVTTAETELEQAKAALAAKCREVNHSGRGSLEAIGEAIGYGRSWVGVLIQSVEPAIA
jgi:hypothetical protein